jgi:branched-chain amino acid transport system substrate-binding protein
VASFKELLKARRPDVEFVAEQWPALGKIDAGARDRRIMAGKPDAIFNVTFGPDLAKLRARGQQRGLFPKRAVVSHALRRAGIPRPAEGRNARSAGS